MTSFHPPSTQLFLWQIRHLWQVDKRNTTRQREKQGLDEFIRKWLGIQENDEISLLSSSNTAEAVVVVMILQWGWHHIADSVYTRVCWVITGSQVPSSRQADKWLTDRKLHYINNSPPLIVMHNQNVFSRWKIKYIKHPTIQSHSHTALQWSTQRAIHPG